MIPESCCKCEGTIWSSIQVDPEVIWIVCDECNHAGPEGTDLEDAIMLWNCESRRKND